MKKILTFLLFSILTGNAFSKELVTLVYSWSPSDNVANIQRHLINEANRIQNKYQFIFDARPGGGGTVAANVTLNNSNHILLTSSAFFIRPTVFPEASYDLNKFTTLLPQCDAPMVVTSSKYKSWKEVPVDNQLNIGTSGLGVTTHLTALQIINKYPNIQVIPFKSTSEALVNMVAGNVDFHVGFLSEPESWSKENNKTVNALGITGNKKVNNHPTLISQGFPQPLAKMSVPFQIVVPTSIDSTKIKEWRKILKVASKAPLVRESMAIDYCRPTEDIADPDQYYKDQRNFWVNLASSVSK